MRVGSGVLFPCTISLVHQLVAPFKKRAAIACAVNCSDDAEKMANVTDQTTLKPMVLITCYALYPSRAPLLLPQR